MTEETKKLEYDDPEQSARFIEIAEQIQTEDADEKFEAAVKRILRPKETQLEPTGED